MTMTAPAAIPLARRLTLGLAVVGCLWATSGPTLLAHPTAATDVVVTLGAGTAVDVALTTDLRPLVLKLEAISGRTPLALLSDAAAVERLAALCDVLIAQLDLRFDGTPTRLTFAGVHRSKDRADKRVVRFTAERPSGARTLQWRSHVIYGSYPFAVQWVTGREEGAPPVESYEWLNGAQASSTYEVAALAEGAAQPAHFWSSIALGLTHIVPKGLDHILFVLGLFLLAASPRTLLLQVSAFTVAHSITLALSLYGVVSLPGSIVEPLIALSIAYVAFENLMTSSLKPWRLALVFAFGLLHGMGFAEILTSMNLVRRDFVQTLIGFNLGVEAGQLAVILIAALAVRVLRIPAADYRRLVVRPASAAIAAAGVFWVIERTL
jgi:hypothetical protein